VEEDVTDQPAVKSAVMLPPNQSLSSTVLNGMGNGMTIAAIPFALAEARALLTKKPLSDRMIGLNMVMLASGAVLGAAYGMVEAKQITRYRNSLNNEINRLHDQATVDEAKIEALTKAVNAKANPEISR